MYRAILLSVLLTLSRNVCDPVPCPQDGYVEGIDTAKAQFLQVGFNLGYREGAGKTLALGRLKGIVR